MSAVGGEGTPRTVRKSEFGDGQFVACALGVASYLRDHYGTEISSGILINAIEQTGTRLVRREDLVEGSDLARALADAHEALRYITQPTMGFPGAGSWYDEPPAPWPDPEQWVRDGWGTESNIRLALATCIGMAKRALAAWDTQERQT